MRNTIKNQPVWYLLLFFCVSMQVNAGAVSVTTNTAWDLTSGSTDSHCLATSDSDVTVDGVILTINVAQYAQQNTCRLKSLTLLNGAKVTHGQAANHSSPRLDLDVIGSVSICTNCSIDVSGKGPLVAVNGPSTGAAFEGGTHGGLGRNASTSATPDPRAVYGSYQEPVTMGGPAFSSTANQAPTARGGGTFHLKADELVIQGSGQINADGVNSNVSTSGAGGSIWLEVTGVMNLSTACLANSCVHASGGDIYSSGSGGRVAVYYGSATVNGSPVDLQTAENAGYVVAYSGVSSGKGAAPGTVYLKKTGATPLETVLIRNKPDNTANYVSNQPLFDLSILGGYSGSLLVENANIEVKGNLSSIAASFKNVQATFKGGQFSTLASLFSSSGKNVYRFGSVSDTGTPFALDQVSSLIVENAKLELPFGKTDWSGMGGGAGRQVTVKSTGVITQAIAPDNVAASVVNSDAFSSWLDLGSGKLVIENGGQVNVSGKGPLVAVNGPSTGAAFEGGTHGGLGRNASTSATPDPRAVYGSYQEPVTMGGPAFSSTANQAPTARGGGTFHLKADELVIQGSGQINADGVNSNVSTSGAGGSIWLEVTGVMNLSTACLANSCVHASGGDIYSSGSGGRVAVYYGSATVNGSPVDLQTAENAGYVVAYSGVSSGKGAAPGTVYLKKTGATPLETVLIRNKPDNTANYVSNQPLFDLSILGGYSGSLLVENANIEVKGNLSSIAASFKNVQATFKGGQFSTLASLFSSSGKNVYRFGSVSDTGTPFALDQVSSLIVENAKLELPFGKTDWSGMGGGAGRQVTVKSTGVITQAIAPDNVAASVVNSDAFSSWLDLGSGKLVIENGGQVNVSGKGPLVAVNGPSTGAAFEGGTHGGLGRNASTSATPDPRAVYGSYQEPVTMGGPAFSSTANQAPTARGGGTFHLKADELVIQGSGQINADGVNSNVSTSGAGGSIWLEVTGVMNLSTACLANSCVHASGGDIYSSGSGGRVAVYYGSATVNGSPVDLQTAENAGYVVAYSGVSSGKGAAPGTVYLKKTGATPLETVLIRNKPDNTANYVSNQPLFDLSIFAGSYQNIIVANANVRLSSQLLGSITSDANSIFSSDSNSTNYGSLELSVKGTSAASTTKNLSGQFQKLTVDSATINQNGALTADSLNLNQAVLNQNGFDLNFGSGSLTYSGSVINMDGAIYTAGVRDFTVPSGLELVLDNKCTVVNNVTEVAANQFRNLTVQNGGRITHKAASLLSCSSVTSSSANEQPVKLTVTDALRIEQGGAINVDGKGLNSQGSDFPSPSNYVGGSYGGKGGGSSDILRGDRVNPKLFGRSGRGNSVYSNNAGGSIAIKTGFLQLDGTISANGTVNATSGSGGGSGGTVALTVDGSLTQSSGSIVSTITAKGSNGNGAHGGGGGRIAVAYQSVDAGILPAVNTYTCNGENQVTPQQSCSFSDTHYLVDVSGGSGNGGNYAAGTGGSVYINKTNSPLRVVMVKNIPAALTKNAIDYLDVQFNADTSTADSGDQKAFDVSDISLLFQPPSGSSSSIAAGSIVSQGSGLYRVNLPNTLADGHYSLTVGPQITPSGCSSNCSMDQNQDGTVGDAYVLSFDVDRTGPTASQLTSPAGLLVSENGVTYSRSASLSFAGTRDAIASFTVKLDGVPRVNTSTVPGQWATGSISMPNGTHQLVLESVDAAGNVTSTQLNFITDTAAPVASQQNPAINQNLQGSSQQTVSVQMTDNNSGVSVANSSLTVLRNGSVLNGDVVSSGSTSPVSFTFTYKNADNVATVLPEGLYTATALLVDKAGNNTTQSWTFAIDRTAPAAAQVSGNLPSSTANSQFTFTGTVSVTGELYSSLALYRCSQSQGGNCGKVADIPVGTPANPGTGSVRNWSFTPNGTTTNPYLQPGTNEFWLETRDNAGNISSTRTHVTINYNSAAPGAVTLSTNAGVQTNLDGSRVNLDWQAYDENLPAQGGGDLAGYAVYQSAQDFTTTDGLTPIATLNRGVKTYQVAGLTQGQHYFFAVQAIDTSQPVGLRSPVDGQDFVPVDSLAPVPVTGLAISQQSVDSAQIAWSASTSTDVNGYRFYRLAPTTTSVANACAGIAAIQSECTGSATGCYVSGTTSDLTHTVALNGIWNLPVCVTARDAAGNQSEGRGLSVVHWLDNPVPTVPNDGLGSGQVALSWTGAQPGALVSQYRIYAQETTVNNVAAFTQVGSMTPRKTVSAGGNTVVVDGLTNGHQYSLAVVAVNTNGRFNPDVTTVEATPVADTQAPQIGTFSYRNAGGGLSSVNALSAGVTQDGYFQVTVTDLPANSATSRVNKVEFYLKAPGGASVLLGTAIKPVSGTTYELPWAATSMLEGNYELTVIAEDAFHNRNVTGSASPPGLETFALSLGAPRPPVVDAPAAGSTFNTETVSLKGHVLDANCEVEITNTTLGSATQVVPVSGSGEFNAEVPLKTSTDGTVVSNSIDVKSHYRMDTVTPNASSAATTRQINWDGKVPAAPTGLVATSMPGGEILLTWQPVIEPGIKGYQIFASKTADPSGLSPVEPLVTGTQFRYTPTSADDRNSITWYFWVKAVDALAAGNVSEKASAISDDRSPVLQTVQLHPQANAHVLTGVTPAVYGQGDYQIELKFDELLSSMPFLSWITDGGRLQPVPLYQDMQDKKVWRGVISIGSTPAIQSEMVHFNLSAYDQVGNVGPTNMTPLQDLFKVDNSGPDIVSITTGPASPVKLPSLPGNANAYSNVQMDIAVRFDETPVNPVLQAVIGTQSPQTLALTEQDATQHIWTATLQVPESAVDNPAATTPSSVANLVFTHSNVDSLGNVSSRIASGAQVQLYKGDLPPLDPPANLVAHAQANGVIQLGWSPVADAAGYRLYRGQTVGTETTWTAMPDISAGNHTDALAYTDTPSQDGSYVYAVATLRSANNQVVESAKSTPAVTAQSDRAPPPVPCGLQVVTDDPSLSGLGIALDWDQQETGACAASGIAQDVDHYVLYRKQQNGVPVACGSTGAMTALVEDIAVDRGATPQQLALDSHPAKQDCYAVASVDTVGNVSALSPANGVAASLPVLPVNQVELLLESGQKPVLKWQHSALMTHSFAVARDSETALVIDKVQFCSGSACAYPDVADMNPATDHVYKITTSDDENNQVPSVETALDAAALSIELLPVADGSPVLNRGTLNQLRYKVRNLGNQVVEQAVLSVFVAGKPTNCGNEQVFNSQAFNVAAQQEVIVPVVVGGDWLGNNASCVSTNSASVRMSLQYNPIPGQTIKHVQSATVSVGDRPLVISAQADNFVRGATGEVYITLENNSPVPVEFVTSPASNPDPADNVVLLLEDDQGHVLASQTLEQLTGASVVASAGHVVVRTPAGEQVKSGPFTFKLPEHLPEQAVLRVRIGRFYYQLGQTGSVEISGTQAVTHVNLTDLPYNGSLASINDQTPVAGQVTANVFGVDQPVIIKGQVNVAAGLSGSGLPLMLVVSSNGIERKIPVETGSDGHFTYAYRAQGESGLFNVSVLHPVSTARPVMGQFALSNVFLTPTSFTIKGPAGYQQPLDLKIKAAGTSLSDIRLCSLLDTGDSCTAVTGDAARGIQITGPGTALAVSSGNTASIPLVYQALTTAAKGTGSLRYQIKAKVGSGTSLQSLGSIKLDYEVTGVGVPSLGFAPTHIETGVQQGSQTSSEFVITNYGYAPLFNARATLSYHLNGVQTSTPAWATIMSGSALDGGVRQVVSLGNFMPGDSQSLSLDFKPPGDGVPDGIYEFWVTVTSDDDASRIYRAPVFVSVQQAGQGSARFHVSDLYTATYDEQGNLIKGLDGATITLKSDSGTAMFTQVTASGGNALFSSLVPGSYYYRIAASGHESKSGRVYVTPSMTQSVDELLMNVLVTVDWDVREITLEDRYQVTLNATYQTKVPAALVAIEPLYTNLPLMKKGEVFNGELVMSNKGLIRADNVRMKFPADSSLVDFEFAAAVPASLAAGETLVIPYRVIALNDFDALEAAGNCTDVSGNVEADYSSVCAEGSTVPGSASAGIGWHGGSCGAGAAGGGGGGGSSYNAPILPPGGGGWSYSNATGSLGGQACPPAPCDGNCNKDNSGGSEK